MKIGKIDTSKQVFIVAELSANHKQNLQIAKDTIYSAKESGADAVKLQTYKPEWMTIDSEKEDFIIKNGLWKGKKLFQLYKEAMLPLEWHEELFKYGRELGLEVFSAPFSVEGVDFLEQFNPPAYKIASFEAIDYQLVEYTAQKGRPIIISTGIIKREEFEELLTLIKKWNNNIAVLKCSSAYPAPRSEINLKSIPLLKKIFNVEVGFSDHTLGISAPISAVSLGARIIEKHFILNSSIDSFDKEFSLTPSQFKEMSKAIREVEEMLGDENSIFSNNPKGREFARSIYVIKEIKKGEILTPEHIKIIRPSFGLEPKCFPLVLGKRVIRNLKRGDRLSINDLEKEKGELC